MSPGADTGVASGSAGKHTVPSTDAPAAKAAAAPSPAAKPAAKPASKPAAKPAAKPATKPAAAAAPYASPAAKAISFLGAPSAKKTVGGGSEMLTFTCGGTKYDFIKEDFRRAMDDNKFTTDAMATLQIVKTDTMTAASNQLKQVRLFLLFSVFFCFSL